MTSPWITAFAIGLISACSLPLGTLVSRFWRPGDRVIAFLMSFGGGALLAALTIDLAGPALARGHFNWLAFGCILGGALFVVLDQVVNRHGGFLRKMSTTVMHLRVRDDRRFRDDLSRLKRLDVFSGLPKTDIARLASMVSVKEIKAGEILFREGDGSDCLFVIEDGRVELLDPRDGMRRLESLRKNDVLGYKAFLTGSKHAAVARVASDGSVLLVPRAGFDQVVTESEALQSGLTAFFQNRQTREYLGERQGLSQSDIDAWIKEAVESVHSGRAVSGAGASERTEVPFRELIEQVSRIPIFEGLPDEDIEFLASSCFAKTHPRGHTFFHAGESTERLHILEVGQVVLIDPKAPERRPLRLDAIDEFGALSFLTGSKHSVTAVASSDVTVRVLLRRHFDELLKRSPAFAAAVERFIRQEELSQYLQEKHHFDADKTSRWVSRALGRSGGRRGLPSAAEMTREIQQHHGAPLAIWLGILLDGIPESLVIGTSVGSKGTVSLSLIAGLFLSNFPEALSSSVGMRQQGMAFGRILLMWGSLMILTGVGAALGVGFLVGLSAGWYSLIEGVAAGAMLTMIAQTMLPEAYFKGGSITGFSTLLGFLSAIFFKTLEGGGGH